MTKELNRLSGFAQDHKGLEKRLFTKMIDRRLPFDVRNRARRAYNRLSVYGEVMMDADSLHWVITQNRFIHELKYAPLTNSSKWFWDRSDFEKANH